MRIYLYNFFLFSVGIPFHGDYVQLRRNPAWRENLARSGFKKKDKFVVFADIVNKANRSNGKVGNEWELWGFISDTILKING